MYYNCSCDEGYTGVNCDQDINECMNGSIPSNICGDNGTCWNTNGSFRCEVSVSTFLMRLQQSLSLSCIDVYHLINSTSFSRLFALFHSLVTWSSALFTWSSSLFTWFFGLFTWFFGLFTSLSSSSRDYLVCSHDSPVCSRDYLVCSHDSLICSRDCLVCSRDCLVCSRDYLVCSRDHPIRSWYSALGLCYVASGGGGGGFISN